MTTDRFCNWCKRWIVSGTNDSSDLVECENERAVCVLCGRALEPDDTDKADDPPPYSRTIVDGVASLNLVDPPPYTPQTFGGWRPQMWNPDHLIRLENLPLSWRAEHGL